MWSFSRVYIVAKKQYALVHSSPPPTHPPLVKYTVCEGECVCVAAGLYSRLHIPGMKTACVRFIEGHTEVCDVHNQGGTVENWWPGSMKTIVSLIYTSFEHIH